MALVSLEITKNYLGISDNQLWADGIRVLVEPGPTSATVQVLTHSMVFVIMGGANPGTYTFDLTAAATDTLTELVAVLNASAADITAEVLGVGAALSDDLVIKAATNCLEEANAQTLQIVDNYMLNQIIDRVSDVAERYCGVEYEQAAVSERYDGDGTGILHLNNRPVNSVTRVCTAPVSAISVRNTSDTATAAYVRVDATTATLTVETGAVAVTDVLTLAAYATMTLLVAAINALSARGWEASASAAYEDFSPTDLVVEESMYALDAEAQLDIFPDGVSDYVVWPNRGWLGLASGFPAGNRNILVDYNYGYAVIPGGLQEAVLRLISIAYYRARTDPTLASERLGDHAWSKGGAATSAAAEWQGEVEQGLALWRKYDIAVA